MTLSLRRTTLLLQLPQHNDMEATRGSSADSRLSSNWLFWYSSFSSLRCEKLSKREQDSHHRHILLSSVVFANCMIWIRERWDPITGHNISVRTPRMRRNNSAVFLHAARGNIKGLQDLFSLGLASPLVRNTPEQTAN